jgi:hypothetical protein
MTHHYITVFTIVPQKDIFLKRDFDWLRLVLFLVGLCVLQPSKTNKLSFFFRKDTALPKAIKLRLRTTLAELLRVLPD